MTGLADIGGVDVTRNLVMATVAGAAHFIVIDFFYRAPGQAGIVTGTTVDAGIDMRGRKIFCMTCCAGTVDFVVVDGKHIRPTAAWSMTGLAGMRTVDVARGEVCIMAGLAGTDDL